MKKPTIAVIFGSRSAEHDVSVITALSAIIKPLEQTGKYEVVPVYIAKDGRWFSDSKLKDVGLFSSGKIDDFMSSAKPVAWSVGKGLSLIRPGLKAKTTQIDLVFPATHGTHGEDGELMGLLEMAQVPYVGCSMPASVLAMDKVLSKLMCQSEGIATPAFVHFSRHEFNSASDEYLTKIKKTLKYPLFVKPAHLGSSIGITKVSDETALTQAIEVALHYDDKVLVEEGVANLIEVTLPVMGNETLRPALLEKPLTSGDEFFDFDTKYLGQGKGGKKMGQEQGPQGYSQIPADLEPGLYKEAEALGLAVYKVLGCEGTARIDMLIDGKTKRVYFNEVNPLPGSLYAHNWRAAGVSSVELVTELIRLAEERYQNKQNSATTFSTNFLKQF